jgi:hypothetical protein
MSRLTDLENQMVSPWGNTGSPLVDPDTLASAAGLFVPAFPITVISGTEEFTGITIPYASFQGSITVLPTGAFTWTAATNIAVLGTAVDKVALTFTYNPVTEKWYPSYV